MKLAVRELVRRPGRFVAALVILTLVSTLVVYLGGLIDATVRSGTGALRAQPGTVLVFSDQSRTSIPESRIDADLRRRVEALDGVEQVGGLGISQLGARLPGAGPRELIDVAVVGYELSSARLPEAPAPGQVYADRALRSDGVELGTVLAVGPGRTELEVVGFVDGTTYDGQGTVWASLATWREVQNENRPAKGVGVDGQQVLVVESSQPASVIADQIDAEVGGTESVTPAEAVRGLPGVEGTRSVFTAVIVITAAVGAAVIALLFALLVVERVPLYGVLKALGVRSSTLLGSLTLQATLVAVVAALIGTVLGVVFGRLVTSGLDAFLLTPARAVFSGLLVITAAVLGAAVTLRRVLRIDPASAIGSAS